MTTKGSVSSKAHLHDTTNRIPLFWRMKMTADATIPVHRFKVKCDIQVKYAARIRIVYNLFYRVVGPVENSWDPIYNTTVCGGF